MWDPRGVVVRLLASHLGEPRAIPSGVHRERSRSRIFARGLLRDISYFPVVPRRQVVATKQLSQDHLGIGKTKSTNVRLSLPPLSNYRFEVGERLLGRGFAPMNPVFVSQEASLPAVGSQTRGRGIQCCPSFVRRGGTGIKCLCELLSDASPGKSEVLYFVGTAMALLLHSGAVPFSPHFILIDFQDLVVKSHPNFSTHWIPFQCSCYRHPGFLKRGSVVMPDETETGFLGAFLIYLPSHSVASPP
ncbi:hypothetical protein PR048_004434 [Dryococelus australis]|uniref:Uncharacterized protein n=1 Tax=Dryococelus australis TaxID=614101 RepID=A0ABQ9I6I4_9NEOP|nr:hypothetical protein PR048_004434 [Dryococelus australis]